MESPQKDNKPDMSECVCLYHGGLCDGTKAVDKNVAGDIYRRA